MIDYNLSNTMQYIDYTEDTWLEERRKGIGGSDVAAILGENKYSSPLKVYKDKVEGIRTDVSDKVFVRKGKDLEGFVRNVYCTPMLEKMGYEVIHPQHIFINPAFPWIRANLDGLAIPKINEFGFRENFENNIVIEIKWVSEWAEDAWCDERYNYVPIHYYMQVQTYMAVTGAKKAIVFALFDKNWEVRTFELRRNEAMIANILSKTKDFYTNNMCMKIPPAIKASIDTEDVVERAKTISKTDTYEEDSKLNVLIANYLEYEGRRKELEKTCSNLKDEIIALHLDGKCPVDKIFKVNLSVCNTRRFNSTKFKEDHPDMYEQYLSDSSYTKFSIK